MYDSLRTVVHYMPLSTIVYISKEFMFFSLRCGHFICALIMHFPGVSSYHVSYLIPRNTQFINSFMTHDRKKTILINAASH